MTNPKKPAAQAAPETLFEFDQLVEAMANTPAVAQNATVEATAPAAAKDDKAALLEGFSIKGTSQYGKAFDYHEFKSEARFWQLAHRVYTSFPREIKVVVSGKEYSKEEVETAMADFVEVNVYKATANLALNINEVSKRVTALEKAVDPAQKAAKGKAKDSKTSESSEQPGILQRVVKLLWNKNYKEGE